MRKSNIISFIALAVILCFSVAACINLHRYLLFHRDDKLIDKSAIYKGNMLDWNGIKYIPVNGEYDEGKTVAVTEDGWDINEVIGDKTYNFVVVRSFLDQYLLVREDYEIPESGQVTAVYVKGKKIEDISFCNAVQEMINTDDMDSFLYEPTESIYNAAKEIYLSYNYCPVGTSMPGYIGFIENKWVFIDNYVLEGYEHPTYKCSIIDDKYVLDIERYI